MPMCLFASFLDEVTSPEIVVNEFISIFLDAFYAMHGAIRRSRAFLRQCTMELLSVFSFGDVFADGEVALVATLGDEVLVEGLEDGATWLVGVGAVAESAIFGDAENLREVVRNFVELHIYHTETFDARGVDEVRLFVDGIHFAEGGGVHTFVVIVRYLSCASVWVGYDLVDNSAFANARIARKEGDFAFEEFV